MKRSLFLLATATGLLLSTAAMALSPQIPEDVLKARYACDFQKWVGTPIADVQEQVRALGRPYRIVYEGGIVTQDYVRGRITIVQDYQHKVQSVSCE